jgi:hypothetical protein
LSPSGADAKDPLAGKYRTLSVAPQFHLMTGGRALRASCGLKAAPVP